MVADETVRGEREAVLTDVRTGADVHQAFEFVARVAWTATPACREKPAAFPIAPRVDSSSVGSGFGA